MAPSQRPLGLKAAAAGLAAAAAAHGITQTAFAQVSPAARALPGSAAGASAAHAGGSAAPIAAQASWGASALAGLGAAALAVSAAARRRNARTPLGAQLRVPKSKKEIGELAKYTELPAEEWFKRVKMVAGDRAVFEVELPKPLGLTPANFPNRPGVGVAKIAPEGNTDEYNRKVLLESFPAMFVLEGDEVVGVNGTNVEGKSLDEVGPLVKESPGDTVKLTLVRYYNAGPVKVIFIPSGKTCTMKRGSEISQAAKVGVEEVGYNCKEGWCQQCWQTDPIYNIVYRACAAKSKRRAPPKNPRNIPEKWVNVMPLTLLNFEEAVKRKKVQDLDAEADREERRKAAQEEAVA